MNAELKLPAMDIVGESAVWSVDEGALYWVDIGGVRLHKLDPETGRHKTFVPPDRPTSIGLCRGGGAIVGLLKTVVLWDGGNGFSELARVEPDMPDNRLNEGRVAPDGSFWVGTMQNNLTELGEPKDIRRSSGAIYRIQNDGNVSSLTEPQFGIANTMIWTDDNRFICADTLANQLFVYDLHTSGTLLNRRDFGVPFSRGLPDGSCLDSEGYIWNCRVVGGGCLVRWAPDGTVDRVVDLPCSWPTSCTFGGRDLDTLFVTSARFTMGSDHLEAHPQEGGLFALRPGVRGRPEPLFG